MSRSCAYTIHLKNHSIHLTHIRHICYMYHIHVYRHSFFCQYQIIFTFEWFYTRPTWCLYNWGFRHINCFSYSFTENKKIYKTPLLTMPNSYQNPREYLYLSFPGSICWIKNTETDQGYAAFCRHPYDRVATSFYAGTCSGIEFIYHDILMVNECKQNRR